LHHTASTSGTVSLAGGEHGDGEGRCYDGRKLLHRVLRHEPDAGWEAEVLTGSRAGRGVSQFVRLEQCERFLSFRLAEWPGRNS